MWSFLPLGHFSILRSHRNSSSFHSNYLTLQCGIYFVSNNPKNWKHFCLETEQQTQLLCSEIEDTLLISSSPFVFEESYEWAVMMSLTYLWMNKGVGLELSYYSSFFWSGLNVSSWNGWTETWLGKNAVSAMTLGFYGQIPEYLKPETALLGGDSTHACLWE